MKRYNSIVAAALGLLTPLILSLSVLAADQPPEVTPEGLHLVKRKDLDVVYVKPGASLAGYTKLIIDPVDVAYSKDWDPPREFNEKDRERVRTELADEFREVFTKELQEKGGYQIVDTAAPDVLRVTAAIVDLYINAPDTSMKTAGRVSSYVVSAGSMVLIAELRDSVTGAILARVADRKGGQSSGPVQWATSGSNRAEARRALGMWAGILRKALDGAKAPE